MGGLSKKAFQLNSIVAKEGRPHLTLDAGDLLFKSGAVIAGQETISTLKAAAIVEAYDVMGYDAVAVGGQDLIAGISHLQSLRKKSKFVWVSANLVTKSTKKLIVRPDVTLKAGGITVGVIGLTGPTILPATEDAMILPWDQVLPELVAKVSKKSDLVILLSNLPAAENQRIAEAFKTIHLIIQSRSGANSISADPVNNTVVVNSGPQGKYLGVLDIAWQPSKSWDDQKGKILIRKKEALEQVRFHLLRFRQDKDPETALRNQPDQLKTYHLLQEREREFMREIDELTREMKEDGLNGQPSTYRNRFIAMDVGLPDHPEVLAIVSRLKEAINLMGQQQSKVVPPVPVSQPYLGSTGCGQCHGPERAAWLKTPHAMAYKTLERAGQQFNPECLPCHVTGMTMAQGKDAMSLPEDRRGVGCESCHGPGRGHAVVPKGNAVVPKPGASVCVACHIAPHDPNFDYAEQVKKVGHGKEFN